MPRGRSSIQRLVNALLECYREGWAGRYRSPCLARMTGRDRRNATEIVDALGLDEARRRLYNYLTDRSRWLTQRRHPLKVFLAQVDQYAGGKDGEGQKGIAKAGSDFDRRWRTD